MTGPNRGSPIYRVMFVDPESTFGTPATQYPVAADAVRLINATVNVKRPSQAREDSFGTATQNGSIELKETVEWSAEIYAYTPGAAATAPDWSDLLQNCGLLQLTAAVANTAVSGAGATTTVIPITEGTGANFTAGVSCVTISGETRRILSIDEGPNPDEITLATPLSAAPGAGVTVTSGITYRPHDGADADPDGATIWLGNNSHMWRLTGAFATTVGVSGGGDGAIRLTLSGRAREGRLQYTGTLGGAINNSVLTVPVANADIVPDDVSVANPYYYVIDRGEAAEEFVQVTGKAGSDLTVVRSSPSGSAHSHDSGAMIEPYQVPGTYAGSPVPATGGHAYLADVLSEIETFSLEVDHGLILREDVHGAEYKVADYVQGLRNVTASCESWSRYTPEMHRVRDAIQRSGIEWFAQQGDTTGAIVAVECPSVYVEVPDFAFDDGEVRLSFSGQARGTTMDEIFIMLG